MRQDTVPVEDTKLREFLEGRGAIFNSQNVIAGIKEGYGRASRMRYLKADGTTVTLPGDPGSILYYLNKGFTIDSVELADTKKGTTSKGGVSKGTTSDNDAVIRCPIQGCEFDAKGIFGLQSHLRVHIVSWDS